MIATIARPKAMTWVFTGGARSGPCIAPSASGEYGHLLLSAEKPGDSGRRQARAPCSDARPWSGSRSARSSPCLRWLGRRGHQRCDYEQQERGAKQAAHKVNLRYWHKLAGNARRNERGTKKALTPLCRGEGRETKRF